MSVTRFSVGGGERGSVTLQVSSCNLGRMRLDNITRPLLASFFAAVAWSVLGGLILPEPNLAYDEGIASWIVSMLVSVVLVGAIAVFAGDGSSARGMTSARSIVAAATGAGIAALGDLAFLFLTTPPDGQDGLAVAYVVFFYIPLLFIGGWAASAAIKRVCRWRRKAKKERET